MKRYFDHLGDDEPDEYSLEMGFCYKTPNCRGLHTTAAHDRVMEEHKVYATVFDNGDPGLGMHLVMFKVLPLLDLIGDALGEPRCWKCGKLGPYCGVNVTVEDGPDGPVTTHHYCGID